MNIYRYTICILQIRYVLYALYILYTLIYFVLYMLLQRRTCHTIPPGFLPHSFWFLVQRGLPDLLRCQFRPCEAWFRSKVVESSNVLIYGYGSSHFGPRGQEILEHFEQSNGAMTWNIFWPILIWYSIITVHSHSSDITFWNTHCSLSLSL